MRRPLKGRDVICRPYVASIWAVLTVAASMASCGVSTHFNTVRPPAAGQKPPPIRFESELPVVTNSAAQGIIVPARYGAAVLNQCSRSVPDGKFRLWVPTGNDVKELEQQLPSFVGRHLPVYLDELPQPLDDYKRQYVGLSNDSGKFVYVNLFLADSRMDWRQRAIVVCDGGAAFFGVLYNVGTHRFVHIAYNGVI